jgi:BTB/POZ domain
MFQSQMLESTRNEVKMDSFSAEIVAGMLQHIYTGHARILNAGNALDLLRVADMYELLDLKGKCEEALLADLRVENASQILIAAHLHSSSHLKSKAMSFIHR